MGVLLDKLWRRATCVIACLVMSSKVNSVERRAMKYIKFKDGEGEYYAFPSGRGFIVGRLFGEKYYPELAFGSRWDECEDKLELIQELLSLPKEQFKSTKRGRY